MLRGQHLFLVPGDSPVGLRLPLPSLPWVAPEELPKETPGRSDGESRPAAVARPRMSPPDPVLQTADVANASATASRRSANRRPGSCARRCAWSRATAACTSSCRRCRLIEDYLDLLTAIEDTAAHLEMPVVIEGYPPPYDPRINQFKVTPDPGVIEVNIHPAHDWKELVANTTALYEEARQTRLGTEKFMLDGRHTGTGGGNHFVLGAADAGRQPVPAASRSAAQHARLLAESSVALVHVLGHVHRADQPGAARRRDAPGQPVRTGDCVRADSRIPAKAIARPGWWIAFSATSWWMCAGNTHRAEFCIDKLYSPDSSTGRLGLLELRGFEMPPHARMSLTQQLLVRALIAWFWKQPYTRPPIAWGTQLHDQFMLPHFIAARFPRGAGRSEARRLSRSKPEWFAPHFEFRYPVFGRVNYAGNRPRTPPGHRALVRAGRRSRRRAARRATWILPWSALQVKVRGLYGDRYVVACNGRRVPLHFTGTQGEWVAGVRYRAWQPPSCLHPTIPVHSPLIFDVVDTWTGRSVGGCTYHVAHPGGRSLRDVPGERQ